jgi:hypothetical protein
MYYPETLYARSKDGNVAYQVVGDGLQDLVFIPSWLNNIDAMWDEPSLAHFLRRLATFSRLLCFASAGREPPIQCRSPSYPLLSSGATTSEP